MRVRDCDHVNNFILFVLAALFFLFCISLQPKIASYRNVNDWDVLIYTQNWPNSVCIKWKTKSPNSTCNFPPNKNDWTIHGIWPTKFGTTGPWFCNTSRPFNMEEIYGILPRLEDQWTRVENHKKHSAFWKHEWEKHGTCAAVLDSLNTEFKYFYQGLVWNQAYNMSNILKEAGIEPSNGTVKADNIISGVKRVLGKNPFVSCYTEPKTKKVFLLEVRLCFDKMLKLVDCDGVKSCSRRKYLNEFRMNDNMDDDMMFASPLSRSNNAGAANLTDCPAGSDLLYPRFISPEERPATRTISPLANAIRLLSFLQWATL